MIACTGSDRRFRHQFEVRRSVVGRFCRAVYFCGRIVPTPGVVIIGLDETEAASVLCRAAIFLAAAVAKRLGSGKIVDRDVVYSIAHWQIS